MASSFSGHLGISIGDAIGEAASEILTAVFPTPKTQTIHQTSFIPTSRPYSQDSRSLQQYSQPHFNLPASNPHPTSFAGKSDSGGLQPASDDMVKYRQNAEKNNMKAHSDVFSAGPRNLDSEPSPGGVPALRPPKSSYAGRLDWNT
jgi:hypothetical protein